MGLFLVSTCLFGEVGGVEGPEVGLAVEGQPELTPLDLQPETYTQWGGRTNQANAGL